LTLPTLPAGTFDLNYMTNDFPFILKLEVGKLPGGYDTVRALFFAVADAHTITTGVSGSAQFASVGGGQKLLARTTAAAPKKTQLLHRTQSTH
jgi:hypothetical protein